MTHTQLDPATAPINTPDDLRDRWSTLIGPLGFGERLLWYAFVGPDRRLVTVLHSVIKVLHHVEVGPVPRPDLVDGLIASISHAVTGLGLDVSTALLLTRPGDDGVTVADRQWATMLTGTANRYRVPLQPIFRANDREIRRITSE